MKTAITITKVVIWVAMAVLIGWDIVAISIGGGKATISQIFGMGWSWSYTTLPLSWGVLTGHLFWVARGNIAYRWIRIGALVALAVVSIILDVVDLYDIVPIVPAMLGVPLGRLGWPQSWPEGHPLLVWKR